MYSVLRVLTQGEALFEKTELFFFLLSSSSWIFCVLLFWARFAFFACGSSFIIIRAASHTSITSTKTANKALVTLKGLFLEFNLEFLPEFLPEFNLEFLPEFFGLDFEAVLPAPFIFGLKRKTLSFYLYLRFCLWRSTASSLLAYRLFCLLASWL